MEPRLSATNPHHLDALALGILVARDGWLAAVRRVWTRDTSAGIAWRWLLLSRLLGAVLNAIYLHIGHYAVNSQADRTIHWLTAEALSMFAALAAGWIVGRAAPEKAVRGVLAGVCGSLAVFAVSLISIYGWVAVGQTISDLWVPVPRAGAATVGAFLRGIGFQLLLNITIGMFAVATARSTARSRLRRNHL